jgi:hypothetical protein
VALLLTPEEFMRCPVALLVATLAFASQAAADWEYAKWGMTPPEVIAASGGSATARKGTGNRDSDLVNLATATHEAGGVRFGVAFLFTKDDQRLDAVTLTAVDRLQCGALTNALLDRYGRGERSKSRTLDEYLWRDEKGRNHVRFAVMAGGSCSIRYSPLTSRQAPRS